MNELREISQKLFSYLEATDRASIEIENDYYWKIDRDELVDTEKPPQDVTLGQLSDDMRELRAIVSGDAPPVGLALEWYSAVLRAVADETGY